MNSLAVLLIPIALLLPAASGSTPAARLVADAGEPQALGSVDTSGTSALQPFSQSRLPRENAQVRIEQRVILRVSPRPRPSRQDLLAQLPRGRSATRIEERKFGTCIPAKAIAGVGTGSDNRLILFMRDRRIISAALEKACNARDFYSGFYVEGNEDGKLCVKRDQIQSRAGAKCELRQLRQLVAVRD